MEIGVSTASLFVRKTTEDALSYICEEKFPAAEVFLSTYREYNRAFGKLLKKRLAGGCTKVHSIHTLNTQYEPQLYSVNPRAAEDSFDILEGVLQAAEEIGAKYYTFHGVARMKKTPIKMDYDRIGAVTRRIFDACAAHGVTLSYETVHWCYYNYKGFFKEVKRRCSGLKGVLDIKQARQSGVFYGDFIDDMGEDIVTVHLSDIDENGKMCLAGKGVFDFAELFKRLKDVNFDGALLIEAYQGDYGDLSELKQSADYVAELVHKIF
ncbi:MAG: hypothetical protein DBX59_10370 [Bacillota bacterium]|nr:MAG: hypothetical protein DBX59_10370 [Bacillota bacterium]